jgi:CTD kinase subunit alpha
VAGASVTSDTQTAAVDADDNPFRPSKDLRVEDEGAKEDKKMPPPTKAVTTPSKSGFSFSLKTAASKAKLAEQPPAVAKEKGSILEQPKTREATSRETSVKAPISRTEHDSQDRDADRDRGRERDLDRDYRTSDRRFEPHDKRDSYYDRRPYRDPRERDPRELRDNREPVYYRDRDYRDPRDRNDSRDLRDRHSRDYRDPRDLPDTRDYRDTRDPRDVRDGRAERERKELPPNPNLPRRPDFRPDSRPISRPDSRTELRRDTLPERPVKPERPKTRIIKKTRVKQRPILSPDFAASDSVYYRKPGNESVVGSGTYGKVFKGVHVYTKDMVALKKIRMEGERDGVSSENESFRSTN